MKTPKGKRTHRLRGFLTGRAIFMRTLASLSSPSNAGAVAAQFSSRYGGITWANSLDGTLPGGEHHFSTSPGQRVYVAANPDPFFG
jgi:hypothetical protein